MKKITGILFILLFAGVLLLVVVYYQFRGNKKIEFTRKVTLGKNDLHPYGANLAFEWLKEVFPNSEVKVLSTSVTNRKDILGLNENDSVINDGHSAKALIILTKSFFPTYEESNTLFRFVEEGNDLFVSCERGNSAFFRKSGISLVGSLYEDSYEAGYVDKSFSFSLDSSTFHTRRSYSLTGRPFYGNIIKYNSDYAKVLGTSDSERMNLPISFAISSTNFIGYKYGNGHIYIHSAPVAFTNYFLLEKNNKEYYEKTLSLISPDTKTIIWDNYFVSGPHNGYAKEKSPFAALFQQPSFSWAIWLIILVSIIYILTELKRRQRIIPLLIPLRNDSLDYIKTIGRLYFDKKDNYNLATKMGLYFFEYVRFKYMLDTSELNAAFINKLAHKSGKTEDAINEIIQTIITLREVRKVSDEEIRIFYNKLEFFYTGN